jgi:hypothetical protein
MRLPFTQFHIWPWLWKCSRPGCGEFRFVMVVDQTFMRPPFAQVIHLWGPFWRRVGVPIEDVDMIPTGE